MASQKKSESKKETKESTKKEVKKIASKKKKEKDDDVIEIDLSFKGLKKLLGIKEKKKTKTTEEKETKKSSQAKEKKKETKTQKKTKSKSLLKNKNLSFYLIGIAISLIIFNALVSFSIYNEINAQRLDAIELARPGNIELTIITNPDCTNCFSIESFVNSLTSQQVVVLDRKNLTLLDSEAQELIQEHGIKVLPAVIVQGEVNKTLTNFWQGVSVELSESLAVYQSDIAPYYSLEEESTKGVVKATLFLPSDCSDCEDLKTLIRGLRSSGVFISETIEILQDQISAAQKNDYQLKNLPAIVLSSEISDYPNIISQLENAGEYVSSSSEFVFQSQRAPYYSLETNQVEGLVTVWFLDAVNCSTCYSIIVHENILSGMGIGIKEKIFVNESSELGQELISKYDITAIPTFISSKETSLYPQLADVWNQVGKIINETYIFTNTEWMIGQGGFKDLSEVTNDNDNGVNDTNTTA